MKKIIFPTLLLAIFSIAFYVHSAPISELDDCITLYNGGFQVYNSCAVGEAMVGATITTIDGTDTLKNSRTTINDNFSALNSLKLEADDFTGGTGITYTATGTFSFDCSEVEGTGINCATEAITLDATGDWTGTLDGFQGADLNNWNFATTTLDYWFNNSTGLTELDSYLTQAYASSTFYTKLEIDAFGYLTQAYASSTFLTIADSILFYDVLGQATSTLTSHTTTYNHANYDTAYGWGNHALGGYATQAYASSTYAIAGGAYHDGFSDFVANEHIDWTADQGATNIHAGNYTDTDTTYTAGDYITLTSTDFDVDAEAVTDTKCIYIEDPVAEDDLTSLWFAKQAGTIQSLWCESDQTATLMLQVDDGTPADVDDTDLVCDATPAEDTSLNGDATMASGDRLDLAVTSVASTPTWVSICFTIKYDD